MTGNGVEIGAYRVLHQIGAGGMGSVWLAEHTMLGRRAAIKLLHPQFSRHPGTVRRFFNEARAATAIADPGIVQIFDFGRHVDGSAYIVMELLDGESLDQRLARRGVLELPEALRLVRQAASSLGAAHARGIVHRDLKPGNIFVVRDPEVAGGERAKILDFGIAKLGGDHEGDATKPGAVIGTPSYMSPEQCRGAGLVDQRSDVYALGCMLFKLLVGRPPFLADATGELFALQQREAPPAPSSFRPDVPAAVDQLVLRCLAKDPARRFAHGGELAAMLDGVIRALAADPGPDPSLDPSLVVIEPMTPPVAPEAAVSEHGPAPMWRPWRLALVIGLGVGVVSGVIATAVVRPTASAPPRPMHVVEAPERTQDAVMASKAVPISPGAGAPSAATDAGAASTPEAGSPEAGSPEAGSPEASSPEASSPDAGRPDAGRGASIFNARGYATNPKLPGEK